MDFKTYYRALDAAQRVAFAKKMNTSTGYCQQLVAGTKHIELGFADVIVAVTGGKVTLAELPLTKRAKLQNKARAWDGKTERRTKPKPPEEPTEAKKEGA